MWLLVLMISGMITGGILGQYEAAFASMPLLVTFIPMLTDTGGNAGCQSSTLVIRGMALSEISTKDLFAVMWKEIRVSLIVGIGLGAVNFVRLILTYPGNEMVALTVTLALVATVLIAKTIGGATPDSGQVPQGGSGNYGSAADYHDSGCAVAHHLFYDCIPSASHLTTEDENDKGRTD